MQSTTSTSEIYKMALNFAHSTDQDKEIVLFVICINNYWYGNYFRMNSGQYSAHPNEKEVLLKEGANMYVLGVEKIKIDNSASKDDFWIPLNGKIITVVYLLNTDF